MNNQTPNVVYNNQPTQNHLQVSGGTPPSGCSQAESDSSSVQILTSNDTNSALNAGNTSPFNAHHRRSRSLRERTGVDQRLERLPSGPPNTKALNIPWTVMKGTNLGKYSLLSIERTFGLIQSFERAAQKIVEFELSLSWLEKSF